MKRGFLCTLLCINKPLGAMLGLKELHRLKQFLSWTSPGSTFKLRTHTRHLVLFLSLPLLAFLTMFFLAQAVLSHFSILWLFLTSPRPGSTNVFPGLPHLESTVKIYRRSEPSETEFHLVVVHFNCICFTYYIYLLRRHLCHQEDKEVPWYPPQRLCNA